MLKKIVVGSVLLALAGAAQAWVHNDNEYGHNWIVKDVENGTNALGFTCNKDGSSNVILLINGEIYQIPKIKEYKSITLLVGYSGKNQYTLLDEKLDPVTGNPHRYTNTKFADVLNKSTSFKVSTSDGKTYIIKSADTDKIDLSLCY